MTNEEIYEYYEGIPKGSRAKTITNHFNIFDVSERKLHMEYKDWYKDFINNIM